MSNTKGRLYGKTALITGASRGIGRAIAEIYSAEGASLILTATTLDSLADVAVTLPEAKLLAADLSYADQVLQLFEQATHQAERIDILVNNAGVYQGKPFEQYTLNELDRLMKINVYAVFQLPNWRSRI